MKIAMLAPDKSYEKGISTYSQDLVVALKKVGVNVDLITYKNRKFVSLLKVIPLLKNYDLIHIQHENRLFGFMDGFWFMPFITLLNLVRRGKIIITFHTVHTRNEELFSAYPFLNFFKRNFSHPLNYLFANFFTRLFVVHASFLKEDLINSSNINPNKIIVIPQGVKSLKNQISKETAKKVLGLKGPVYLMLGTIGPNKGFDLIIDQAKNIKKTILIAGGFGSRQDYINYLKDQIIENKLQGIVRFDLVERNTPLTSKEWETYLLAADIILLPYKVMSTSGVFIDAMAASKPVIGSNSRYFNEIFEKYGCIEIAKKEKEYYKQIKKVMDNIPLMEKESKRFAKENSIFNVAKKYKKEYSKLFYS